MSRLQNYIFFILKKPLLAIVLGAFILMLGYLVYMYIQMDSEVDKIKEYSFPKATQILDRKDRLVANVFEDELRFYVNFEDIPPHIIEALLATEDTLFFEHGGVNFDAISRAFIKNISHAKYIEGGSTLTQQLIKNIVLTRDKTIERKLKEIIISIHTEKNLTKEEILERYLNHTFFGHGYYGIKTASLGYFKKELDKLTLKEIAILVGLPKAPSFYDPTKNLDKSLDRANAILDRLLEIGWITPTAHKSATQEIPTIYDETLTQNKAPYVVDEVLKILSTDIPDIRTGGYKVKLYIDLDYQLLAQEALNKGYENINKRLVKAFPKQYKPLFEDPNYEDTLNGAMVVTQNATGQILALSGGVDHAKSSFNRATQTKRQFGSSVKPFVYQSAFNRGYSPASQIADVARVFAKSEVDKTGRDFNATSISEMVDSEEISEEDDLWKPKNFSQNFTGLVTLKDALRRSLNLATLNLVEQIGFLNIYKDMQDFGFTQAPKDMSVILGSFGISPLEAAHAYSLFSNYGSMLNPILIESVILPEIGGEEKYKKLDTKKLAKNNIKVILKDKNHNIVAQNIPENIDDSANSTNAKDVISQEQAFLIVDTLKAVVENGTGTRAKVDDIELAGKTGTSNKNVDAWFCGFSPEVQAVIWYGRDDNTPIGKYESGGVVTGPVFHEFFRKMLVINPATKRKFNIPENVKKKSVGGEEFYYTDISKMPSKIESQNINEELLF